ncbi:MAG: polyprenyl diphosphate synthase, partial [Planctomycetota bacterium]
ERPLILRERIRFRAIGDIEALPAAVRRELDETTRKSEQNQGLVLCLALNYSGRSEIVAAARSLAADARAGRISPEDVTEEAFTRRLATAGMRDPDLVIRTAGEQRLSNFLLWQSSYAELYTTKVLWPDFRREDLWEAILDYARRDRKFGGLSKENA